MFEGAFSLFVEDAARVGPGVGRGDTSWAPPGWDEPLPSLPEAAPEPFWDEPFPPLPAAPPPPYGTCEPSGWLALDLDTGTADEAALSDETLIEAIVGFGRLDAWAAARQARLLAELLRRRPRDPVPNEDRASAGSSFAPDEVGVALRLARGTAVARLHLADRLLTVLPDTHALWESGLIDTTKARAIHEATIMLPDVLAAAVEARVLPRAPQQSLPQLRAALARAVIAVDPGGAAERHQEARRDRRVCVSQENDGMASLWALLTAPDAAGAYEWLTRLARGLGTDDPRTIDARRADLLADLLNGRLIPDVDPPADPPADRADEAATGEPATDESAHQPPAVPRVRPVTPGKPLIQVVMTHSTLIGADDQPAELVGEGPIPADMAREIAADAVWRRLVTDPLSGTLLDHGRTTYHPPAGLADHVRVRDRHCRFPLCRRRAADAELDHALAWADGGETNVANLHALCRRHHTLKHHAGWRIEAHPDGRLTWTTPTGHRHTTSPHDHRTEPPEPPDPRTTPAARAAPISDDPDPPPF